MRSRPEEKHGASNDDDRPVFALAA
jgi:hypothetical protein